MTPSDQARIEALEDRVVELQRSLAVLQPLLVECAKAAQSIAAFIESQLNVNDKHQESLRILLELARTR